MPSEADYRNVDSIMQTVPPGTSVMVRTGGGAGWGNPLERNPELVKADVVEGNVSIDAAYIVYGVVFDAAKNVDVSQTAAHRTKLKATVGTPA
jgi:N-methylhydantoinase B